MNETITLGQHTILGFETNEDGEEVPPNCHDLLRCREVEKQPDDRVCYDVAGSMIEGLKQLRVYDNCEKASEEPHLRRTERSGR